jgi:hypothetical protein
MRSGRLLIPDSGTAAWPGRFDSNGNTTNCE